MLWMLYAFTTNFGDVPTFFLGACILVLLGYGSFYMTMKFMVHKEKTDRTSAAFAVLGIAFGTAGVWCFANHATDWTDGAARLVAVVVGRVWARAHGGSGGRFVG